MKMRKNISSISALNRREKFSFYDFYRIFFTKIEVDKSVFLVRALELNSARSQKNHIAYSHTTNSSFLAMLFYGVRIDICTSIVYYRKLFIFEAAFLLHLFIISCFSSWNLPIFSPKILVNSNFSYARDAVKRAHVRCYFY